MKSYKRVASAVLGMAMAASCMAPITAFAAEDFQQPTDNTVIANHPNDETMLHSTPVYRIGTKSFYKVNDDGSVTYADQDTAGFKAIPAAYIMGSSYNKVGEYGIYTTTKSDGTKQEHFVKISDCQEANGKVNWNHGTADEAKVSDDTKANGVDTATNEDPTMSTQFYIYLDNDSEIPAETPPTEEEHPGVATDDTHKWLVAQGGIELLERASITIDVDVIYAYNNVDKVEKSSEDGEVHGVLINSTMYLRESEIKQVARLIKDEKLRNRVLTLMRSHRRIVSAPEKENRNIREVASAQMLSQE